ncbi:MAG: bifunctional phosphopantothenoylcysteine decarboxylase/phosphopantothenate--cysteine ligase CoaBC [Candidatus Eiseniibacteriota bacterium]|nr:MAG: bifunctional phosphopantothenoylcysteine decarboxylase/phosphopantothenate--cysteine ligase CoaBC [Candidatus Eisenbacteria bacterium]
MTPVGGSEFKGKRVLLGITGSIAAYKGVELLRELTSRGATVTVCMTRAAREFVAPLTFEVLSGRGVLTDLFASPPEETAGLGPRETTSSVQHIEASAGADVVLIAPATANIIGKVASGIADDLLSSIVMAAKGKVVFAPAMNVRMWENPVVQENISRLRSLGYCFVEPDTGALACGEEGKGRLAPTERIVSEVEQLLRDRRTFSGTRVLVTAGRTEEPIDHVRYVSNRSSGKMGYALASAARDMGADVTLVSGRASVPPPSGVKLVSVRTAAEMRKEVMAAARKAAVVIMTAAVSDFAPARQEKGKIPRGSGELTLRLRGTRDILGELGKKKGKRFLVGFAVEVDEEIARAKTKLKKKNLDLIVVNNPLLEGAAFEGDTNIVSMIDRRGRVEKLPRLSKYEVAREVLKKILTLRK